MEEFGLSLAEVARQGGVTSSAITNFGGVSLCNSLFEEAAPGAEIPLRFAPFDRAQDRLPPLPKGD